MNIFTIDASTLIGANVFGVSKADLLSGQYSNPSVVTYTDWAPYPGFTIVPSMTQVCASPASQLSLVGRRIVAGSGTGDAFLPQCALSPHRLLCIQRIAVTGL